MLTLRSPQKTAMEGLSPGPSWKLVMPSSLRRPTTPSAAAMALALYTCSSVDTCRTQYSSDEVNWKKLLGGFAGGS